MDNQSQLGDAVLEALRGRITKVLPAQIRSCVEQLNDEQIWWRPNEQSNSVGNLVLHVSGGVMHYLCHLIGGFEYERDRENEFASRSLPKEQLLAVFDEMVHKSTQTFSNLSVADLDSSSTVPRFYSTIFEDLFGIAIHVAAHTGQIVYATKLLQEGSLKELWMVSHSELGIWKVSTTS